MDRKLHPFVMTELRKRAGHLGITPWHLIQMCLVKHFGMEGMNIPYSDVWGTDEKEELKHSSIREFVA